MNPIEQQLAELNSLCIEYETMEATPEVFDRIRQIFLRLRENGYQVLIPTFELHSAEYEALSEIGKLLWKKPAEIRKKKMQAIENQNFEFAADLRTLERALYQQIVTDFSESTSYKFFVLLAEDSKEIIYNDPDGKLNDIFKIS